MLAFLCLVALPLMLLHLWWFSQGGADTPEEPFTLDSALAFARPAILFVIGIPCVLIGLRRRKNMEASHER
jgi:hypothetical protein